MVDNTRRTAIMTTYQNLTPAEKESINRAADRLIHAVKAGNRYVEFGRLSAIEVLGALGMFLASKGEGPSAS